MATKAESVTELVFYDYKDVMRICGVKRTKAYEIIGKINAMLEKHGKITLPGKVNARVFNSMF